MLVSKNGWGNLFAVCLMLSLILGIGGLIIPGTAGAEIAVTVTGDGVITEITFTQADLQAMEAVQARYSSINTYPTKTMYVAEGIKLADLIRTAGIKDDAKIIKVTGTDGYKMIFTRKELLNDQRYYYPGLQENHEYFGYIPGSPDNAVPVDTILALKNAESDDFNDMNDSGAPILMMGQRWVTEQSKNAFVKNVGTIEVLTETPEKWENPTATPLGGTTTAGTGVALSTSDMDGDSIYYTTNGSDPTVESSMYNWIKKRWWGNRSSYLATINHPIEISQDMTIKAVAIGFGKEDSDIVAFDYQIPTGVVFTVTPEADSAYAAGTTPDGISTMIVSSGITGFKYFVVNVTPVTEHSGNEAVVFTHLRDGVSLNVSKADLDQFSTAQAGFNVEANDVIKAFIVDDLTNSTDAMPVILQ